MAQGQRAGGSWRHESVFIHRFHSRTSGVKALRSRATFCAVLFQEASVTRRKLSLLLLLAASIAAPLSAGTHSAAAFKKLQSLAGDWVGKDGHGMAVKTSFKALASGTAVMETLSPAGMEEMVTLYSIDGDGIALVHYCPTNNQPRMRVVPDSDDIKELSFDYQGAGNLKSPSTGHQHHLTIRFDDAEHITETWTWRQDDKDIPMLFHLTRKKN